MADSNSDSDAEFDLDWRRGGPHKQRSEGVLTESQINVNGHTLKTKGEFSKQRKKDANKRIVSDKPRDLVNLDSDSDSQAKASRKGALGASAQGECFAAWPIFLHANKATLQSG